jgi:DNA-binding HxlR family transcriptional regulator
MSLSKMLSENKTISIILSLIEEPKHIRGLQRDVHGSLSTVEERVNGLIKEGIVEVVRSGGSSRIIILTNKGKQIASFLKSMEKGRSNQTEKPIPDLSKWLLIVLYSLGRIRGSTRLEKILFLLKDRYPKVGHNFYDFVPKTFGPYTKQALIDAKTLQAMGLIEISEESFESWELGDVYIRKDYSLTEKGRQEAEKLFAEVKDDEEFKKIIDLLQTYNSMPLTLLLKQVHEKWPQYYLDDGK